MTEHLPGEGEPLAIFSRLREVEIPETLLASVSAGVRAEIDREARALRVRPVAAWAAAAGLAATLLVPSAFRHAGVSPLAKIGSAPRAGVEAVRTQGQAQVLDLTVGDTQVVMIFDAELAL